MFDILMCVICYLGLPAVIALYYFLYTHTREHNEQFELATQMSVKLRRNPDVNYIKRFWKICFLLQWQNVGL